jgi:ATP-dependent DNA ligase
VEVEAIPPVEPPVAPMLARLARALPVGEHLVYEPKWDGFRALAFRTRREVDIRSRNNRPLARYFPELEQALGRLSVRDLVVDGEIVVARDDGRFDFPALMRRLHPAGSRVERLQQETPASFIAFDLLALDGEDLRSQPFASRRTRLESLFAGAHPPLFLTPSTDDHALAAGWLENAAGAGVDGVVVKDRRQPYTAGKRTMLKVKRERMAVCVVAGFRWRVAEPSVASLLLGLYDRDGTLRHVGVVTSFSRQQRRELLSELAPLATELQGHAWAEGFGLEPSPTGRLRGAAGRWTPDLELDWEPLRPELVCEVAYDQLDDHRFRYPARFRGWRRERDPRTCTLDQLDFHPGPVLELLSSRR